MDALQNRARVVFAQMLYLDDMQTIVICYPKAIVALIEEAASVKAKA